MTTGALPRRPLGSTGLNVTGLGYGSMELKGLLRRGGRPVTPEAASQLLNTVLDSGINFIDTSIDYGESEEHIGRSIAHRRDEFFLASKCGCPLEHMPDAVGTLPHDYRPSNIRAGVEQSLQRLRTDYLDVLQVHLSPSSAVIVRDEVLETLNDLRSEGKARSIGISSTSPHIVDHIEIGAFQTFQVPYSLLERDHEADIAEIHRRGAGVIVRGGVARGGNRSDQGKWDTFEKAHLDELREGESRAGFLLRYVLANPAISTVIVGTLNAEHLQDNCNSAKRGPLAADVYDEVQRRLAVVDLEAAAI